jgi:hypothetical protein
MPQYFETPPVLVMYVDDVKLNVFRTLFKG